MSATEAPTKTKELVQRRPAESAGVASAIALLICTVAGLDDPAILTAIAVVIGFIPAAVTWLVVTIRSRDDAATPPPAEPPVSG